MRSFPRLHAFAAAVCIGLAASAVSAQTRDDSIYRALGEQAGVKGMTADFLAKVKSDSRTEPFFRDIEEKRWTKNFEAYFCQVSGGPCRYEGDSMKKAHEGMDLTRSDFNAIVEILQDVLQARGVPFSAQNRLLARLAPTHRDIVNVH